MMSLFARESLEKHKNEIIQAGWQEVLQEGWEEGWEVAREEARREGKAELLLRMLQMRFGILPESIWSQVTSAGSNDINTWSDRLFQADSLQAVFR
ncbi:MAG: DUF4351 domain-containing protein [Magnetococcales bacterium]|nr:DUF4351 domain-containing protein [Magnetococcales bacterium]